MKLGLAIAHVFITSQDHPPSWKELLRFRPEPMACDDFSVTVFKKRSVFKSPLSKPFSKVAVFIGGLVWTIGGNALKKDAFSHENALVGP